MITTLQVMIGCLLAQAAFYGLVFLISLVYSYVKLKLNRPAIKYMSLEEFQNSITVLGDPSLDPTKTTKRTKH